MEEIIQAMGMEGYNVVVLINEYDRIAMQDDDRCIVAGSETAIGGLIGKYQSDAFLESGDSSE